MKKTAQQQYRHELKYRVSRGTYEILRQRFRAAMIPDSHAGNGIYRVTSLYLDDVYRTAYREKLCGTMIRKKFRIRAYDLDPSFIRLEEKCKDGDVGYKKSAPLTLDEYHAIIAGDKSFLAEERFSDTAGEDLFWADASARLTPAAVVDYLREPYICREGNVRITFDMQLRAGTRADMFDPEARYVPVLEANEAILEIKYDNFIPGYIEQLIGGLPLLRESVSKFVICCETAEAAAI